jgi:hypothetical protein
VTAVSTLFLAERRYAEREESSMLSVPTLFHGDVELKETFSPTPPRMRESGGEQWISLLPPKNENSGLLS